MKRSKKITAEKVNAIPTLLFENKITLKDAQDIVWEHIYTNPVLYEISDLTEDQRSDFLLFISRKIKRYLTEYEKERKMTFISYVTMLLFYEKKSWMRIQAKKYTEQLSGMENFEMNYESQFESYKKLEPEKCVAELTEIDIEKAKKLNWNAKRKQIAKETILFMLLKACHSIDDRMIDAVSRFCEMDEERVFKLVEALRNKTFYRLDNQQQALNRIQNQYYFHKRYEMEITRVNEETKDFSSLQKKIKRRKSSWRRSIYEMTQLRTPSPSNSAIAEVLDTSERTVQRYLERAKKQNSLSFEKFEKPPAAEKIAEPDSDEESEI